MVVFSRLATIGPIGGVLLQRCSDLIN
jgi:hypothetical protein